MVSLRGFQPLLLHRVAWCLALFMLHLTLCQLVLGILLRNRIAGSKVTARTLLRTSGEFPLMRSDHFVFPASGGQ